MPTPELKDYIARARAAGFSDQVIREELVKAGWNPLDVKSVLPGPEPVAPPSLVQPSSPRRLPYLSVLAALLAVVVLVLGYLYVEKRGPFADPLPEPPLEIREQNLQEKMINSLSPEDSKELVSILEEQRKRARDARRVAEIGSLRLALLIYYDQYGTYPATLDALVPDLLPKPAMDPDPMAGYGYAYNPYAKSDWKSSDLPLKECSASKRCEGYHVGISLEFSDPKLLEKDDDKVATGGASAINGSDAGRCLSSQIVGNYCYDLTSQ